MQAEQINQQLKRKGCYESRNPFVLLHNKQQNYGEKCRDRFYVFLQIFQLNSLFIFGIHNRYLNYESKSSNSISNKWIHTNIILTQHIYGPKCNKQEKYIQYHKALKYQPALNRVVEEQHLRKASRVSLCWTLLAFVFLVQHKRHNGHPCFADAAYRN